MCYNAQHNSPKIKRRLTSRREFPTTNRGRQPANQSVSFHTQENGTHFIVQFTPGTTPAACTNIWTGPSWLFPFAKFSSEWVKLLRLPIAYTIATPLGGVMERSYFERTIAMFENTISAFVQTIALLFGVEDWLMKRICSNTSDIGR